MIDLKQEKLEKKLIEDMCPPELKEKVDYQRLKYARIWVLYNIIFYIVLQIMIKEKPPFYVVIINWILTVIQIVGYVRSFYDIKVIKILIFLLQLRNYILLF